ncbi:MAG: fumarylacetoacetate hydrolase family protein [Paracoccaceae bacterium]|nr:fumarylacetoacetate hydrolase family protein [Paracoccaceae bacterium]
MGWVIEPAARASLSVVGTDDRFPVRRVYCIGRNYAAHAIEMGHDPSREPPFFFQKNPDNLDPSGRFPYPPMSDDVHHEVELYLALGTGGAELSEEAASRAIFGTGIAIDMTRRDRQGEAKKAGRPWEVAKAFEGSAPAGPVHAAGAPPGAGRIALSVNGETRQEGDLAQMIWKPAETIAVLSRYFTLAPGDVILTGTPAGVGPVARGDRLQAEIAEHAPLDVEVV